MIATFQLMIHQHLNDWLTVSVLHYEHYRVAGPTLGPLREELSAVLAEELASGRIYAPPAQKELPERRVVEVELRAIQQDRLILVPMRFTLLVRALTREAPDLFELHLPRLDQVFRIRGEENITPWAQEVIRGALHLKPVNALLALDFERGERVETLEVTYNPKKARDARQERRRQEARDALIPRATPLREVGVELTAEAREGRLPRALLRDDLVRQLMGALEAPTSRSVLLLGPSGVGKTALVHELAWRIAHDQAPPRLQDVPVWHVTGGRIIAGMKFLGEWQERCLAVVQEIRNERGILYADSALELILSGSTQSGQNVASFLLPWIQSGEIAVIAEATPDALILAEQHGANFLQAFRRLPVPSFTTAQAYQILDAATGRLEKEHRVRFSPEALSRALDILARFGAADALPGSGLALIDQIARLHGGVVGPKGERPVLGAQDAIAAFSRSSGFPRSIIDPDQRLELQEVRSFFDARIIGQPQATQLLTNLVAVIKASLNDPERPLGSFLFMGPTGVGKTESALTLASWLFGDKDRLIRLDMSEYGYYGAAARLVGGSRGEGELTRRVREQPFSIILLDEIEKADPEVFDVLLQVLGEGRLTDGTGRTVRFEHTIVIMTSNLGAGRERTIGLRQRGQGEDAGAIDAHYREAARAYFKPELLNRIDFLVPFRDLGESDVRTIARLMLDAALQREGFARRNIEVAWQPEVLDLLMEHGFDPRYGARPMKRAVEQHVLIPLSRRLVLRADTSDVRFDLYLHQRHIAVASSRALPQDAPPLLGEIPAEHVHLIRQALTRLQQRLQGWDEGEALRAQRQRGEAEVSNQIHELAAQLSEYTASLVSGAPSPARHAAFSDAFDRALLALEWRLLPPPGDRVHLLALALDDDPETLEALEALAASWRAWVHGRGGESTWTRLPRGGELRAEGPQVGALRAEIGRHRLGAEGAPNARAWIVTDPAHDPERELPLLREAALEPPSAWDPVTSVEVHAALDALAPHLDRLLLARLLRS